jgi:hypothetical protein
LVLSKIKKLCNCKTITIILCAAIIIIFTYDLIYYSNNTYELPADSVRLLKTLNQQNMLKDCSKLTKLGYSMEDSGEIYFFEKESSVPQKGQYHYKIRIHKNKTEPIFEFGRKMKTKWGDLFYIRVLYSKDSADLDSCYEKAYFSHIDGYKIYHLWILFWIIFHLN